MLGYIINSALATGQDLSLHGCHVRQQRPRGAPQTDITGGHLGLQGTVWKPPYGSAVILRSAKTSEAGQGLPVMKHAGGTVRGVAQAFLESKAIKALSATSSPELVAIEVRERVRTHAGPPGRMVAAAARELTAAEPAPAWVLPPSSLGATRPPPGDGSRI